MVTASQARSERLWHDAHALVLTLQSAHIDSMLALLMDSTDWLVASASAGIVPPDSATTALAIAMLASEEDAINNVIRGVYSETNVH